MCIKNDSDKMIFKHGKNTYNPIGKINVNKNVMQPVHDFRIPYYKNITCDILCFPIISEGNIECGSQYVIFVINQNEECRLVCAELILY